MKSRKFICLIVISVWLSIPTPGVAINSLNSAHAGEELSWTGCGITKNAFMNEIAEAYEKKTGVKIRISGGGAAKGIRSVSAGTSDLGGTCRHRLVDKAGKKHPQEKDAILIQVAWDALVAIAHPDNPVDNITLQHLKKVYAGEIISWTNLGGQDKRIALITRSGKYSGVGHLFRLLVFNDPDYEFKARSFFVKSTGPLEAKVEKTVNALGIDGISSAKKRKVKRLSINGIQPTKENIASGAYPLFRPLYITVNQNASEKARKIVDFILSPEGQDIISRQGTVNLEEGSALKALWEKKKN